MYQHKDNMHRLFLNQRGKTMSKMIDSEKVIKAIKDGIANDWSMSAREAIEIIRKYEQPVSGDDNPRLEASFIADSISDYGKKQPVSGGVDEPAWILPDSLLKFLLGEADYHGIGFGEKGDNRGKYWWRNDLQKLRPYLKQPAPADETNRAAEPYTMKSNEILEAQEHGRQLGFKQGWMAGNARAADETPLREAVKNFIRKYSRIFIHNEIPFAEVENDLLQALSQPSKPAMTREELAAILDKVAEDIEPQNDDGYSSGYRAVETYKAIDALISANIISIKSKG